MLLCARCPEHLGPICQISGPKVAAHLRKVGMLRARAWVPERVLLNPLHANAPLAASGTGGRFLPGGFGTRRGVPVPVAGTGYAGKAGICAHAYVPNPKGAPCAARRAFSCVRPPPADKAALSA
jgi:hypothetical protein